MALKRFIHGENKPKRKSEVIMIEWKTEIIVKSDKGATITKQCMVKSTLTTIMKNEEAVKRADVAMGVKKATQVTSGSGRNEKNVIIKKNYIEIFVNFRFC